MTLRPDSQLERDITKRIHERYQQWIRDSLDLCEMASCEHLFTRLILGCSLETLIDILAIYHKQSESMLDFIRGEVASRRAANVAEGTEDHD